MSSPSRLHDSRSRSRTYTDDLTRPEFDRAIQLRPLTERDKYIRYELNRAEARIRNQRSTELVLADVLSVLASPKGRFVLETAPVVRDWVTEHAEEVRAKAPAGVALPQWPPQEE